MATAGLANGTAPPVELPAAAVGKHHDSNEGDPDVGSRRMTGLTQVDEFNALYADLIEGGITEAEFCAVGHRLPCQSPRSSQGQRV
jgi:hypothetical protein